jgi:hypothetical protein
MDFLIYEENLVFFFISVGHALSKKAFYYSLILIFVTLLPGAKGTVSVLSDGMWETGSRAKKSYPIRIRNLNLALKGTVSRDEYFFEGLNILVLYVSALMVFKVFRKLFTALYNC